MATIIYYLEGKGFVSKQTFELFPSPLWILAGIDLESLHQRISCASISILSN